MKKLTKKQIQEAYLRGVLGELVESSNKVYAANRPPPTESPNSEIARKLSELLSTGEWATGVVIPLSKAFSIVLGVPVSCKGVMAAKKAAPGCIYRVLNANQSRHKYLIGSLVGVVDTKEDAVFAFDTGVSPAAWGQHVCEAEVAVAPPEDAEKFVQDLLANPLQVDLVGGYLAGLVQPAELLEYAMPILVETPITKKPSTVVSGAVVTSVPVPVGAERVGA